MNIMETYIRKGDIIKVKGDGNCFYRAHLQSMRVKSDDSHVMRLKRKTADYIRTNREQFNGYCDDLGLENEAVKAERYGVWADHLQVKAVTKIATINRGYNIRIWEHIGGNKYSGRNMDDSFNGELLHSPGSSITITANLRRKSKSRSWKVIKTLSQNHRNTIVNNLILKIAINRFCYGNLWFI